METKLFDVLDRKIDKVDQQVEKLTLKVDDLLQFKWQVIGGTLIFSALGGLLVQLIVAAAFR